MNPLTVTRVEHSAEDILALIDAEARARRGLSAEQFLQAYHQGMLEDSGEMADLIVLADLLPDDETA